MIKLSFMFKSDMPLKKQLVWSAVFSISAGMDNFGIIFSLHYSADPLQDTSLISLVWICLYGNSRG